MLSPRCRGVPKNNGKDAEAAFVEYWEKRGHIERLRDKKDLMGLNGGKNLADFAKPSDFLVSARGTPLHYAEVKSTVDETTFHFKNLRPGQHIAAIKAASKGDGNYIFYIFSYPLGAWFTLSCAQYAELIRTGKRSIKFKELDPWIK